MSRRASLSVGLYRPVPKFRCVWNEAPPAPRLPDTQKCMPGRKQSAPEYGSLDGARRCICDPVVFPDCPGHRPPYLAGQRTKARASLKAILSCGEVHEAAFEMLSRLRPHDDDEDLVRRTEAKTPWRAHAGYHWPEADGEKRPGSLLCSSTSLSVCAGALGEPFGVCCRFPWRG